MSRKSSRRGQPEAATSAIAPLKTDPKYGLYPWWPEDGDDWVHPEDIKLARSLVPSPRIFKRDGERGEYVVLRYGPLKLRVKRTLWREVAWEGLDMGDWVEVMSLGAVNTWRTGVIREMRWSARWNKIHYYIDEAGQPIAKAYSREDLRHVEPTLNRTEYTDGRQADPNRR